jgi:hypothetical protein
MGAKKSEGTKKPDHATLPGQELLARSAILPTSFGGPVNSITAFSF